MLVREKEREEEGEEEESSAKVKILKKTISRILSTSAGVGGSTVTRSGRERAQGLPKPSRKRVPVFYVWRSCSALV